MFNIGIYTIVESTLHTSSHLPQRFRLEFLLNAACNSNECKAQSSSLY